MLRTGTLREMLLYCDWINDQLFAAAATLDDARLDQPAEIGMGSLRKTLIHTYNGEFVWTQRAHGRSETPWPSEDERVGPAALHERLRGIRGERDALLERTSDTALSAEQVYRDSRGMRFRTTLGDMWMQYCVHSMHHRAQILNLLRHSGVELPKPGADYIFMRLLLGADPPPPVDLASLRYFYEYSDAAQAQVHAAARKLSDAQLDQAFDLGLRTLRATLLHIRFAEQWWLDNWVHGPGQPFPELPPSTPLAEIEALFAQTAAQRQRFLASRSDADLQTVYELRPRPGVVRRYPLGVSMLQLCHHGVHHRAQISNMLRRVGGEPLDLDYMISKRCPA